MGTHSFKEFKYYHEKVEKMEETYGDKEPEKMKEREVSLDTSLASYSRRVLL